MIRMIYVRRPLFSSYFGRFEQPRMLIQFAL